MAKERDASCRRNAFHTTILLENSQKMWQPAPDIFELDLLNKNRAETPTVSASSQATWLTWAIEGCMEYCRIGWDIVPDYGVSISACGEVAEPLVIVPVEPLNSSIQNLASPRLRNLRLRFLKIAKAGHSPSVVSASLNTVSCMKATDKLRVLENDELMTAQIYHQNLADISAEKPFFIRIILITSENSMVRIRELIRKAVMEQNLSYMARFEVAVISAGSGVLSDALEYQKLEGHGEIFIHWYSTTTGSSIVTAMKKCLLWDLRLSKTVITDIPMKEDAKSGATTSFAYDVELFHPCLVAENRQPRPSGEVLRMKWGKPIRGPVAGFSTMDNTIPIPASASEPTTRPTMCLVGYVVDGNAIFVESKDPPVAGKLYLCGGKICMQQLISGSGRAVDDFPSLSDLPGGRVSSYRMKEMVSLLSCFPLDGKSFPLNMSIFEDQHRATGYFPLVYNETTVFLLPQLIWLFDVITVPAPPDDSWSNARDAIDETLEMEKKGQNLPVHSLLQNVPSANRKAEGYAILFAELDMILESHAVRSGKHLKLWTHFKNVMRKPVREDLKAALKERVRSHIYQEPLALSRVVQVETANPKKMKARPEFEGRLKWGRYGKLYQNLPKSDKNDGGLIHASLEL